VGAVREMNAATRLAGTHDCLEMTGLQRLPPMHGTKRASGLSQIAVAKVSVACMGRTTGLRCPAVIPVTFARPS
jgi:hypothetical protein